LCTDAQGNRKKVLGTARLTKRKRWGKGYTSRKAGTKPRDETTDGEPRSMLKPQNHTRKESFFIRSSHQGYKLRKKGMAVKKHRQKGLETMVNSGGPLKKEKKNFKGRHSKRSLEAPFRNKGERTRRITSLERWFQC